MEETTQPNGRYGIDIHGVSTHAEMDSLIEILALLKGQAGRVQVIDRDTNARTFEGSVREVRDAIRQDLAKKGVVTIAGAGVRSGDRLRG